MREKRASRNNRQIAGTHSKKEKAKPAGKKPCAKSYAVKRENCKADGEEKQVKLIESGFSYNEALFGEHQGKELRVLITGGAGYLGSVLTTILLARGYSVSVYDRFIYDQISLEELEAHENLRIYEGDIRDGELLAAVAKRCDVIVNLAAIVGDEACMVDPDVTWEINVLAVGEIARIAKDAGIKKVIHASTCSNYGRNGHKILNESAPLNPISLYARSKVESENLLIKELSSNDTTKGYIMRFSTLFGFSRRPRFDLVVNTMTASAWKHGRVRINGGGQWRPLLHVSDAASAILSVIEAEESDIENNIFNVGSDDMNFRIVDIGNVIKEVVPEVRIERVPTAIDKRDYRVDFSRIRRELGFVPSYSVAAGVREILFALDSSGNIDPEHPQYSNFKFLSLNNEVLQWDKPLIML